MPVSERAATAAAARLLAANDNAPVRSPSQHRRETARIMAQLPPDDSEIGTVKSWPTATRLERANRWEDLAALVAWGEMLDAAAPPANDNWADVIDAMPPTQPDTTYEFRPTDQEIAKLGRRRSIVRRVFTTDGRRRQETHEWLVGQPVRLAIDEFPRVVEVGGLRYEPPGRLVEWRSGKGWRRPHESWTKRTVPVPLLDTASVAGDWNVDRHIQAKQVRGSIIQILGAGIANVLDWAASSATSRRIGEGAGRVGKAAERLGADMVDLALRKLREVPSFSSQPDT